MYASLNELVDLMQQAGARVINGTELSTYKTTVSPNGWNWYDLNNPQGSPSDILTSRCTGTMVRHGGILMNQSSQSSR